MCSWRLAAAAAGEIMMVVSWLISKWDDRYLLPIDSIMRQSPYLILYLIMLLHHSPLVVCPSSSCRMPTICVLCIENPSAGPAGGRGGGGTVAILGRRLVHHHARHQETLQVEVAVGHVGRPGHVGRGWRQQQLRDQGCRPYSHCSRPTAQRPTQRPTRRHCGCQYRQA